MGIDAERLIAFAQSLVRERSLSGQERAVVELILAEMRALGFDRAWADVNGSAIGLVEGASTGPTLLLDGHCDTVSIAPGSRWTRDPFGAEIEDALGTPLKGVLGTTALYPTRYLYGRGVADMKGALAAMLHAAASVDRARLAGRVVVSATVVEEVMEGVSLRAVMEAVQPDYVVIGEATELALNRGGRGRAEIQLETLGQPAHSSSPQLGLNAVHRMLPVVSAIERLPLQQHPIVGEALFVLTDIISDPYPGHSVVPSRCRVTYDRRLLPGETPESVLGAIMSLPEAAQANLVATLAEGEHATYTGQMLRGQKFFPAWILEESHPLVESASRGLQAAGLAPRLGAYRFCTNAAYSAGVAGVPTVGFGPGSEGDAHVVDERLELRALIAAARGYRGIIEATCCVG